MYSFDELVLILMSEVMNLDEIDRLERTYGEQDGLEGFDVRGKSRLWLPLDDHSLDEYERLYQNKQLLSSFKKWLK
ncbi:MAG TPA: hypothetical protein GX741_01275 [Erysipelothrix sp.]|nr:hypothetical protein [Erysipelothrix sp.]